MKQWILLKQDILKYKKLSEIGTNWRYRYLTIKNRFLEYPVETLKEIAKFDPDIRVREEALSKVNLLKDYTIRKDFNNVVTIKLIIPVGCNYNCNFCYNKQYSKELRYKDIEIFKKNLPNSLEKIATLISPYFPISLDITGGEPTLNVELFKEILNIINISPSIKKFCRITLNTNGYNLKKVIKDSEGIINYVNISTHNYSYKQRCITFNSSNIFTTEEYKNLVLELLNVGIDTSTISVLYKEVPSFKKFLFNYIKWCKDIGFTSLRLRNDVFWENSKFNNYMNSSLNYKELNLIQLEKSNDSTWCRLSDNEGFFIFFLNGVNDTSKVSKGIEYIIHNDGLIYTDYYKQEKFENYKYPYNLILDLK